MQTFFLSFGSEAARRGAVEKLPALLDGRTYQFVEHAPVAPEINAPVMGTDGDGLPIFTTPGSYGPVEWRLEIAVLDGAPPPEWPEGAASATSAPTLVLPQPHAMRSDAVTPDAVRAETLRRLCLAFGARDQAHLAIKVQDAMMRAGVLTDKRVNGDTLTAAEEQEAQHLRAVQAIYARLKAVGNRFEAYAAEGRCPADFRADHHWNGQGRLQAGQG